MTEYRLYWLGGSGKIAEADWLEASSDEEAILLVRGKKASVACELWEGARLVASISPLEPGVS